MAAKNMFKKCRKVPNGAVPLFFFTDFLYTMTLFAAFYLQQKHKNLSLHHVEGWAAREVTGCGVG